MKYLCSVVFECMCDFVLGNVPCLSKDGDCLPKGTWLRVLSIVEALKMRAGMAALGLLIA